MRDRLYGWGLFMMVFGGASLADHITFQVDAFPVSAVIFGLGFIFVCMSYGKKNRR